MSEPTAPPESRFLQVIKVWAALAWADGVISPAESVAMKKLIAAARQLSEEERTTALGWLRTKVDLDTDFLTSLAPDDRRGIYRAAAQLAAVDLEVATPERAFLVRLRHTLEIDENEASEIVAGIPGYKR